VVMNLCDFVQIFCSFSVLLERDSFSAFLRNLEFSEFFEFSEFSDLCLIIAEPSSVSLPWVLVS
jgi:hypothetical protein